MNRILAPLLAVLTLVGMLAAGQVYALEERFAQLDTLQGQVTVLRGGDPMDVREGLIFRVQDVIRTEPGGKAIMQLGRHGFVELGPDAELILQSLPHSSYAKDLNTALLLNRGYMRVVWKRPPSSTVWPFFVYMGSSRASLMAGEYFFQIRAGGAQLCTAAGDLAVQTPTQAAKVITPPTCGRVDAAGVLVTTRKDPNQWIAVRSALDLRAAEPVLAVAAPAASAPDLAPVAPAPALTPRAGMDYSLLEGETGPAGSVPAVNPTVASAPAPVAEVAQATSDPNSSFEINQAEAQGRALANLPTASAAAVISPTDAAKGRVALNIASVTDAAAAQSVADYALSLGQAAVVRAADIKGKRWYRVQVGNFASAADARAAMPETLRVLGLSETWVVPIAP